MKLRAADMMLQVPWLITADGFNAMRAIASQVELDPTELAQALHGPQALVLRDGQRRDDSTRMTMRDGVAIIPIDGPIFRYANMFVDVSGGVSTASITRDFASALSDPLCSAILLRLASPGGEAEGIAELADIIYAARGRKPLGAYAEGMAASAAYWLASATDVIGADSTAMLGSIGALMTVPDPTAFKRTSLDFVSKQSPKKRPDPTTEAGKAEIQRLADDLGGVFVAMVARNRGVSVERVLADFGQGGLLVGQMAVDAGLADYLTSEEAMIADLAARARGEHRPAQMMRGSSEERPMKLSEIWAGFFKGAADAGVPIEADNQPATGAPAPAAAAPAAPAVTPLEGQVSAQIAELRAELAKARAAGIEAAAQQFVTGELAAGRMLPAERDTAMALYRRAAELDASTVQQPGTLTNVELLTSTYAARPARDLTRDMLPNQQGSVLPSTSNSHQELLSYAEQQGRAYGERQNGTK